MNNMTFSVCMSFYKIDNTTDFADAVLSIYNQTCWPDEIILFIDGPVPAIMHYKKQIYDRFTTFTEGHSRYYKIY